MSQKLRYIIATALFLYGAVYNAFSLPNLSIKNGYQSIRRDTASHKDTSKTKSDTALLNDQFILKPVIGLGTGMFSYIGNIKALNSTVQNPMTSRIGYDLSFSQKLNPVMEFSLYALFGQLSVNDRSPTFNWNFQSEIRGGGAHLLFKILPKQNLIPYVVIGAESFEFLTKTDLFDNQGNRYYYWNDGTIRNGAQGAPGPAPTIIYRDYTYETDMRSLNISNSGKYETQTFAIPIGIGFMFHLTPKADFLIGTTLHYTFTKHMDGIGDSTGHIKNDMFFMTSISLRYDLSRKSKKEGSGGAEGFDEPDSHYDGVDFAGMLDDTIKPVAQTDALQSDSAILRQYQMYMDSTGQFATIDVQNKIGAPSRRVLVEPVKYTVQLGRYGKGIPADVMDKLLSIPDVKSTMMPDSSSVYTVGDYYDFTSAQNRQQQIAQNGLPDAKVVYHKGNDFIPTNTPIQGNNPNNNPVKNNQPNNNPNNPNNNPVKNNQPNNNPPDNNIPNHPDNTPPTGNIVYRIQLGAYSHKLSRDVFMNINNLVEVKTENGFYTYSCGSFTNYQNAVDYKTQLLTQGFPDVFIKAYQNGKRVPLNKAGATYVTPSKEDLNEQVTHESSTLDKTQISFSVQVGTFKGTPPANMASKYKQMSDIRTETDSTGLTHYVVGKYSNYQDAKTMKDKLAADPLLKGAFTVAYFKDKPIPLNQALSILKQ
jgi:hypothetical protein